MCWALYAASDQELPIVPWDRHAPGFHALPLAEEDRLVANQFTFNSIVYLGACGGCSCGFLDNTVPVETVSSLSSLTSYLSNARQRGAGIEIFLCWEGSQGNAQSARKMLAASAFASLPFPLGEDEFATIA